MGFFGVSGVYASIMGAHNYGDNPTFFLMFGLFCLAIIATTFPISEIISS